MNIVLLEPEIPQNTGNIARTCAVTNTTLHLIKPLGFDISDKAVKRAGLDYWQYLDLRVYENIEEFFKKNKDGNYYFATTKGQHRYDDVKYEKNDYVFFGKETKGLPETLLHDNYDKCIRIPMLKIVRSLNLANSVAIVLYEALRQTGFEGLEEIGHLTQFHDFD
ncbi:MAG: tRNA (uridine(34)/cytosine(34)/5-carboxymethylaminomethyluridine(34)-2'-O)-methyltransferase TrmL [Clostridia bacterium]|nr:tRNA (uridine(34)/cytosine(34)/5-carboxymethylaminomethyluridine(34)-2'-O)-methyltransferase TrmL [Clostridia bacterium]MDY5263824.1 tRNA (uridine(34)/cytosine(34)/5-carboxymethylaminomethyluridine(34)-2'-O)-methyltransferase TrmL [Eubacteriales bacterium]MDY5439362.1 tRNA (uridine(34)/cytosine(34)/5-carboxymethylaminomethyluridine(34)-2'-O)-methyltransferase TrmL [Eubacteriales bacterium]